MSAKLFYSYSDENRDIQKQIGCMNGLFQSFIGGRRVISQNHRRLPPGPNSSHGVEPKSASERKTAKKVKSTKEKQKSFTEPSRTSVSSTSSCSTSHSSSDSKKTPQTSQRSSSQTSFPETPTRNSSIFKSHASSPLSQSLDLRDVVKDSINRETRGLSVKTATTQEPRQHTLKYIDSPRPLQPPRSAKTRSPGPNEPFQVAKLQDALRISNERKDGSLTFRPKDGPRFSYDERVPHDTLKIKLKELPRLSLDSRENRIKVSMKSDLLGELSKRNANFNDIENQQEPGSSRGPSSIVAKLMGLDDLPTSTPTIRNQTRELKASLDMKDQSPRVDVGKQNPISSSPRRTSKESTSPCLRKAESAKTPITGKCPIEPALWKQSDLNKGQKSALKCKETPTKEPNSSLSVYGEIEKRLAQIEFKKSGRDLRALKQILEAMQKSKEKLESRKEDQASDFVSQKRTDSNLDQNPKFTNLRILEASSAFSATSKGTGSPRNLRTAVTIMKPAKVVERTTSPASSASTTDSATRPRTRDSSDHRREKVRQQLATELTSRCNNLRSQSSQFHQAEKNTIKSPRLIQPTKVASTKQEIQRSRLGSDTIISLKQQQKKVEVENHSHSTSESEQSIKSQLSTQQPDPSTPDEKCRYTSLKLQEYDHLMNGISYTRYLSYQGDASSVKSESNMSLASTIDNVVSSIYKPGKINSTFFEQQNEKWKNPAVRLMDDGSTAEPLKVSLEQPSPVSVLDAAFYEDESPSPVKKISSLFKDDRYLIRDEAVRSSRNSNDLPDCRSPSRSLEHDCGKRENTQHLHQKAVHLGSTHEEVIIEEISPIYNSTNPDHKYISEILLASDIPRELESGVTAFQFHPSGHPINPSVFLTLEQTKKNTGLSNDKRNDQKIIHSEAIQKHHRKLVFDAVNEILASKLPSYNKCFSPDKLADRRLRGYQLMQDLCTEIDNRNTNTHCSSEDEEHSLRGILWEDLTCQYVEWTSFQTELPLLVLDLERLIFKDLITEVVNGITANLQVQPGGHCRQLFS